jgi:hypothetical protein
LDSKAFFKAFPCLSSLKEKLDFMGVKVEFEEKENKIFCFVIDGPFKMGAPGKSLEEAFVKAAKWVLPKPVNS